MTPENAKNGPSFLDKAREHDPKRNIAFNAADIFRDPEEIRRFMAEYIDFLSTGGGPDIESAGGPARAASLNMGYVTSLMSPETVARWNSALEGLEHPYFG